MDKAERLIIKGAMSELPEEQQKEINGYVIKINELLFNPNVDEKVALVALALVAADRF